MSTTSTDRLAEAYQAARPRGAALHAEACRYFAALGATHFARAAVPFRPYITRASGSRKWDADGHEYVDYVMGHGALVLGHNHPDVVAALQQQLTRGIHFGDNHELEVEWARRIQAMMPSAERVEFFACGQEANLMAIRLARIHTARRRILRLRFNYHGWADELAGPYAAGTVADAVTLIDPNDLALLERELRTREYAILLVEGGGAYLAGRVPIAVEYYQALPDLTRRSGTVLLLDEVVTCFREGSGGWQAAVGIRPDLTTVGKAVSGGLPAGGLLGRAELFQPLDPGNRPERLVVHGGTWNALPLTAAAGIAACRLYQDGAPQRLVRRRADTFKDAGNAVLARLGIRGRLQGRTVVHLILGDIESGPGGQPQANRRLDLHLLQRGISTLLGDAFVFSAAHTEADVEQTVNSLAQALQAMQEEGTLPP